MKNYVSSQELPYFMTVQQCQILQVEIDGGDYWTAVTGSNSFPPASVILGCWTKMLLSILPFLSCGIPADPTPSGLPHADSGAYGVEWWMRSEFLRLWGFLLLGFWFVFFLLCSKSSRMVFCLEILKQWANDCKHKTPRCLIGESVIRQAGSYAWGYGKTLTSV